MPARCLILFDDGAWAGMLPLTWLRPVCELRLGAFTLAERWERLLGGTATPLTQDYLSAEYPMAAQADNYLINAALLPTQEIIERVLALAPGEAVTKASELLAARLDRENVRALADYRDFDRLQRHEYDGFVTLLRRPHDLFTHNAVVIRKDFDTMTAGRTSAPLSPSNTVIGTHPVFLEDGASVEAAVINTEDGPVYFGAGAKVLEGCLLRGPLVIGQGAVLKMGAKVYGGTTVGPWCKVGGEVTNVVFQGSGNKSHDGYLGNAVIGQWCNIGADTNASNLKNNYAEVRAWDYTAERFTPTGLQFCGLIMGDHAKCGINTMFNTGTVIGVGANVFGGGFPRAFVPDFSWGGASGMVTYRLDKMIATAERVLARRAMTLTPAARGSLEAVYELTAKHRTWERSTTTADLPPS